MPTELLQDDPDFSWAKEELYGTGLAAPSEVVREVDWVLLYRAEKVGLATSNSGAHSAFTWQVYVYLGDSFRFRAYFKTLEEAKAGCIAYAIAAWVKRVEGALGEEA